MCRDMTGSRSYLSLDHLSDHEVRVGRRIRGPAARS